VQAMAFGRGRGGSRQGRGEGPSTSGRGSAPAALPPTRAAAAAAGGGGRGWGRGRRGGRGIPDHVLHPHKYTVYTLDEPLLVGGGDADDEDEVGWKVGYTLPLGVWLGHTALSFACWPGTQPCILCWPGTQQHSNPSLCCLLTLRHQTALIAGLPKCRVVRKCSNMRCQASVSPCFVCQVVHGLHDIIYPWLITMWANTRRLLRMRA
jgi:hypothetical protein